MIKRPDRKLMWTVLTVMALIVGAVLVAVYFGVSGDLMIDTGP